MDYIFKVTALVPILPLSHSLSHPPMFPNLLLYLHIFIVIVIVTALLEKNQGKLLLKKLLDYYLMLSAKKTRFSIVFFLVLLLTPVMICDVNSQQLPNSQQNNDSFIIDNVSDNDNDSVYPQVASFDDNVYVTWEESMAGLNRLNYDILLKSSTDGGRTFGDVINLSNNTGFSEHPQISVNGRNVYVVWADDTSSNRDIYITASTDGGRTFGDVINLSDNAEDSHNQEIDVVGNNVYVTWQDTQKNLNGNSRVSFISSTDGGRTFGDVINLSDNAGTSSFPKISSFKNNVYVIWNLDSEDEASTLNGKVDGIFLIKSADNGNSFGKEIKLNLDEKPGEAQIAANDNDVYVVWGSPDPSVSRNNIGNNGGNDGGVVVVGGGIFFIKSADNGNNFTAPLFIEGTFNSSYNVEMISHSDELIIAVQGSVNEPERNQDIFMMKSLDRGNSFSDAINISNNTGVSECPSAAVSLDNDIFLTWQDNTPGNNDVLSTII